MNLEGFYIYEHQGHRYWQEEDIEEDNIKIFHMVKTPEGKTIHMDYSPYSTPSLWFFKEWIRLGYPERIGCGPLNDMDLTLIALRPKYPHIGAK